MRCTNFFTITYSHHIGKLVSHIRDWIHFGQHTQNQIWRLRVQTEVRSAVRTLPEEQLVRCHVQRGIHDSKVLLCHFGGLRRRNATPLSDRNDLYHIRETAFHSKSETLREHENELFGRFQRVMRAFHPLPFDSADRVWFVSWPLLQNGFFHHRNNCLAFACEYCPHHYQSVPWFQSLLTSS